MKQAGFTLIELLVVVIIMGLLTSIALPQYRKAMDRAKAAEAMQMLPAIFEARERWMIEHGCKWDEGEVSSTCSETLNFRKLDIESKGTFADNDNTLVTPYFNYFLVTAGETNQPCVSAEPRWGANRGLAQGTDNITPLTIYYRGDKFTCDDGAVAGGCDLLNVADDNHRAGCI